MAIAFNAEEACPAGEAISPHASCGCGRRELTTAVTVLAPLQMPRANGHVPFWLYRREVISDCQNDSGGHCPPERHGAFRFQSIDQ